MKEEIDGYKVIEEFLLTKGEDVVKSGLIPFRPLIDFALIVYNKKANATNRLAIKFDLERFFMRRSAVVLYGTDVKSVRVPKAIIQKVADINNQYRGQKHY